MTTPRSATGRAERRDGARRLVIPRATALSRATVWAALTTPDGLAPWIGTYDGDPSTGIVTFRMTAEDPNAAPSDCRILVCRVEEVIEVEIDGPAGMRPWRLRVALSGIPGGGTQIEFSQPLDDADDASSIGPGWEYYLDRMLAAAADEDLAPFTWDSYFPAQAEYYRRAFS